MGQSRRPVHPVAERPRPRLPDLTQSGRGGAAIDEAHLHCLAVSDASFADTDRPVAIDDVEMAVFEGEVVLFRESTRMVHRLNSVAGAVWLLCDGEIAVGAMADELGELFGTEPATLTDGIHEALCPARRRRPVRGRRRARPVVPRTR